MGIWNFQSVLNRGEIDPLAVGRIDLQQYYNGVALAKNVLAIPQGGLKKRPGQEYLGTAVYATDGSTGRLERFSYSVDLEYLLVFTDLRMQVYKNGVLQTNLNGSGLDYIVTPWDIDKLNDFDYIQSADTIIITHEDVYPKRIVRGSDTTWTLSDLPLINIPEYDFNDSLSPTPTTCSQTINFANYAEGDRFKLSLDGILTDEIVLSITASGLKTTAKNIETELLALPNTGNGVSVTATHLGLTIFVDFSGDTAEPWDAMAGTATYSQNVAFTINTAVTAVGVSRKEAVWSATRGWPRTATFHEGRLFFGGSKSRPQTIWGSFVNDYFNFYVKKALSDESVSATLDTDQLNTIQGIFSNRSLQIFTSGGEFYVPVSPITPETIAVKKQSNYGAKKIKPVSIDGVSLFVQKTGKALLQYVFDNDYQANQTTSVSVLAPHLIKNPVKTAVSQGTESSDANYVYIVNDDGTMTVFNTLLSQDVAGFTRWESGDIKSVAVVDNKVCLLIRRFINGTYRLYIERENSAYNMDSVSLTTGSDITTGTGLDHLEGEVVNVKADGYFEGTKTVESGEITINYFADSIEAGLEFLPTIITMPLNVSMQSGPNSASKKKIMRVSVQIHESNGVIIAGQRIADKTIGVNVFDAPAPQTGLRRIFLSGWSTTADVTITQDTPFPLTILNIGMEVKV